jgi:hypothetical protein
MPLRNTRFSEVGIRGPRCRTFKLRTAVPTATAFNAALETPRMGEEWREGRILGCRPALSYDRGARGETLKGKENLKNTATMSISSKHERW